MFFETMGSALGILFVILPIMFMIGIITYSSQRTVSFDNLTFQQNDFVNGDVLLKFVPDLPAAVVGELTTRTDNDTGTITMDSASHGIETGDVVSIFWSTGSRRRVVVGTVSGTSVPIDGGTGDNLPTLNSDVTVSVETVVDEDNIVGDNLKAFVFKFAQTGPVHFIFLDEDGTTVHLYQKLNAGEIYDWNENLPGFSNPIAGDTVSSIVLANGDSAGPVNVSIYCLQ